MNTVGNALRFRFRNLAALSRYHSIVKAFAPTKDLILLFHGIDNKGNQRYNLRFTAQADFLFLIETLKKHYQLSCLEDLTVASDRPRFAITFDDGYKNWKTHLLPLLEEFAIPATLFITTISTTILWTDQYDIFRSHYSIPLYVQGQRFDKKDGVYRAESGMDLNKFLKASGYEAILEFQKQATISDRILDQTRLYWELLNEADIRGLSTSPWVRIGSHGITHASFDRLDDESLVHELVASKAELSRITGAPINQIAFPSGRYDKRVIDFARRAGYQLLLAEEFVSPETAVNSDTELFERKGIYSIGNKYRQFEHLVQGLAIDASHGRN